MLYSTANVLWLKTSAQINTSELEHVRLMTKTQLPIIIPSLDMMVGSEGTESMKHYILMTEHPKRKRENLPSIPLLGPR